MHRKSWLNSLKGKLISKCVKCIILVLNEKLTYIFFIALTIENVPKCCFRNIRILCLIEMSIEVHRTTKHENA